MRDEEELYWLKWWEKNRQKTPFKQDLEEDYQEEENFIKRQIRRMRSPREKMRKAMALEQVNPSSRDEEQIRGHRASGVMYRDPPELNTGEGNEEGEIEFIKKKITND